MMHIPAHKNVTHPAAQVAVAPVPAARAAGLPWCGPDEDRLNALTPEELEDELWEAELNDWINGDRASINGDRA